MVQIRLGGAFDFNAAAGTPANAAVFLRNDASAIDLRTTGAARTANIVDPDPEPLGDTVSLFSGDESDDDIDMNDEIEEIETEAVETEEDVIDDED
jgi:hypothetical protein